MTRAHSIFIIALTLANIAGALWLLWWTRRSRGEQVTQSETTGHVWDEDLRELNNPLPRWWLWLFIITVAFAGVYLALYPGLGSYSGTLGWSSRGEHAAAAAANAQRIERAMAPYSDRAVADLAGDPAALNVGRNLFLNNCAACHGSDGGGAPGFPNLSDDDWLWGGDADALVATIADGRIGAMPPWGEALGEQGVVEMAEYVQKLGGGVSTAGPNGQKFAMLCAACHGADARGNKLLGAPDLTDGIWLHGGTTAAVRETIAKGRTGAMPAHGQRLGTTRVKLVAAYVMSLRAPGEDDAATGGSGSVGAASR